MNFDHDIVEVYFALIAIARSQYYQDERAHDLAADAVTKAIEHRKCYDESRPLLPWCRAIMRNLWINTETRLSTMSTIRLGDWDNEGGCEADQHVRCKDITDAVSDMAGKSVCIGCLVEHARGYTVSEIAKANGLAEGTVKRRIHEARKMLRQRLESG